MIFPWRRAIPSFEQFRIPSPNNYFYQVWLKLAEWLWRRSRKCKSLQTDGQTDMQTDERATGDQNSSLELLAQVSQKSILNWLLFAHLDLYLSP
jgi:hypothetical protein